MMGVGVQIAVGSSQIKKHLDQVKKKVVEFYCGVAEKHLLSKSLQQEYLV